MPWRFFAATTLVDFCSKLVVVSTAANPIVEVEYTKGKNKEKFSEEVDLSELIEVKGWKALGNRLNAHDVKKVKLIAENSPEPQVKAPIIEEEMSEEISEEQVIESKIENSPQPENGKQKGGSSYNIGETIELDF